MGHGDEIEEPPCRGAEPSGAGKDGDWKPLFTGKSLDDDIDDDEENHDE